MTVIQTSELTKSYGKVVAVQQLSLSIKANTIAAFLGENGAGKSTTIKMLLGMVRPSCGDGLVLGKHIGDAEESRLFRNLHANPDRKNSRILWQKAWLETRSRFLACLATLTIFRAVFVGHAQTLLRPEWTADYNRLLFVSQQYVVMVWVLAVVLLGMGGIVREKASGTSNLTLSLPVSRNRLLMSRVGRPGIFLHGKICFLFGRRRIHSARGRFRVGVHIGDRL